MWKWVGIFVLMFCSALWAQVNNPPTAAQAGAVPTTGGPMTGPISGGGVTQQFPVPGADSGTATTTLRQVTNRTRVANAVTNGITSALCRFWEMSYVPVSQIQMAWANWYVNTASAGAETGLGAASTVAMYVEYPRGTYTTITWSGNATLTATDGATTYSDIVNLGFTIPAYARFWVWTYAANATNFPDISWTNANDPSRGDAYQYNGGNTPGTITNNTSVWALMPAAILSYSNKHVVCLFGDSLTSGVNDSIPDASGGQGLYGRAVAHLGPQLNLGEGGDYAEWFASSHTLRVALATAAGCDIGIDGYGENDINNGRTSAQLLADRETIRGLFSFPMYDVTITPETTSSDNWYTATNQTITNSTNNTHRTTFNAAQRAGLTTSPGLIDVAALFETVTTNQWGPSLSGGVWIPRFMDSGGSGIHPGSFGYANDQLLQQTQTLLQQFIGGSKTD